MAMKMLDKQVLAWLDGLDKERIRSSRRTKTQPRENPSFILFITYALLFGISANRKQIEPISNVVRLICAFYYVLHANNIYRAELLLDKHVFGSI